MSVLGFVVPVYPGERRVALLPEHINGWENEVVMEFGFGASMGVLDDEYSSLGVRMMSREQVFQTCDDVFCLKLLPSSDYSYLRSNHCIFGWTHPTGSGADFMNKVARPKGVRVVDLDNIYPTIYQYDKSALIDWIPKNFIWKNSWLAGFSATQHGLMSFGLKPDSKTKVAVLSAGNVSQGAFVAIAQFGADVRLFHRSTISEFYEKLGEFEVIINGIEMDRPGEHIMSKHQLALLKPGVLVIDAAADAGNAIEGTRYTTIDSPIYTENNVAFYVVNNAPSIYFREASKNISEVFSKHIFSINLARFRAPLSAI